MTKLYKDGILFSENFQGTRPWKHTSCFGYSDVTSIISSYPKPGGDKGDFMPFGCADFLYPHSARKASGETIAEKRKEQTP